MTTAAGAATRNAPETDSRKTQVTVSRAIHVLSTEDKPLQVVTHRDRVCRNLENQKLPAFSRKLRAARSAGCDSICVSSQRSPNEVEWEARRLRREAQR